MDAERAARDATARRRIMVDRDIAARGISNRSVLQAMHDVPREEFVPAHLAHAAYVDAPLPLGEGQTISQPYIVALMLSALDIEPDQRVLEVGTGSGYGAAVLAYLAGQVYTIERNAVLAEQARARLVALGYWNVHVRVGDGSLGWPEAAPFDAIVVTAAGPEVPPALLTQLSVGGRLVMPVGSGAVQQLLRVTRVGPASWRQEDLGAVQFVPLIGAQGWQASQPAM